MSTILNSLSKLDQALEKLESATEQQNRQLLAATKNQNDLFAAASNGNSRMTVVAGGQQLIDAAVLAKKLDIAIERVEQVLREG